MAHRTLGSWFVGVTLVAVTWLATPAPQAQAPRKLALVGGMLLTGYEVPPVHHAAVVIEGNKIVAAGPASEVRIPPEATIIDTSGRTMMPGLIETHAHLVILGHGDYSRWFAWIDKQGRDTMLPRVMAISAKQLLMAGVTTAVDLGAPLKESFAIRDRIAKGELPGPRMMMSGPWLTRTPAIFPADYQIKVTSPEQAGQETERLAASGVDVIKAHAGLTFDDYKAIVAAAHRHNLKVTAHVYAEEDTRHALEAGVDILTHVGSAGTSPPYSADLIRDIVNAGRPVVVTAAHRSWIYPDTASFPERLQDRQLEADFGPAIHAEVQDSLKNWPSLSYFARTDREMFFRERGIKQFIESGAVMGMGTDNGTPMNFHTDALWREIKVHVDMGMTPRRAIGAATRVNAAIIGRGRELGTIEPGKLGDVIVVDGDPLFDVVALSRVEVVIKDGTIYRGK